MRFITLIIGATVALANPFAEKQDAAAAAAETCCCCNSNTKTVHCKIQDVCDPCNAVKCLPGDPTVWDALPAVSAPATQKRREEQAQAQTQTQTQGTEECCCCNIRITATVCQQIPAGDGCVCPAVVCSDGAPTTTIPPRGSEPTPN